jgi:ribosomal protein L11
LKKKYSFESIIGKKSKVRMPRHVFIEKQEKVIAILPANNAIAEPPFSTNITMKKGDPYDLCDQVNEKSQEYNTDIPLRVTVTITNTATVCEVSETPTFQLLNMAFDLEERTIESLQASKTDLLLANTNFAILKSSPSEDTFTSDILANTKSVYGSLLSYNCRRKKVKASLSFKPKSRFKYYLKQKINNSYNKEEYQKHIQHFVYKAFLYETKRRLPLLFERIDYFYDILDDWDESYDHYWKNHYLTYVYDLMEYTLLSINYKFLINHLNKQKKKSLIKLHLESVLYIVQTITKNNSKFDIDLLLPLKALKELKKFTLSI